MNFNIDKLSLFIEQNLTYINLIGGIAIMALLIVFRGVLSKAILKLISKIINKKDESKTESFVNSLLSPLKMFFAALGVFIAFRMNLSSPAVLKIFKIAVILIICWAAVNYLSNNLFLILHFDDEEKSEINTTALKFISNILKILIIAFAIVMVISELGYNITGLITGIGIGGLAISLAAQDAVSNLISGFIIVLEKPFGVNDFIKAEDISGTVCEVTMRSTVIRTVDDSLVTIPNSKLTNAAIINISRMEKRLIDLEYGLTYSTPNELIKKCQSDIKEYLKNNELIVDFPLRVELEKLDDYSLNLNVFCYTVKTDVHEYKSVVNDVNYAVKKIIEDNGAEFAFPTSSIYIEKN